MHSVNPKTLVLIAIAASSFAFGFFDFIGVMRRSGEMAILILQIGLVFAWYVLDSNHRNYKRTLMLNFGVVALAGFALPYYLFRSRGVKGGFIALALFMVGLLGIAAFGIAGQYSAYFLLKS